jgi:DNA-binding transcriptional ArsR family regulator
MQILELKASVDKAERLLKALANRQRLMILCELHQGERSVAEINSAVPLSQSALSQHLARLREEGLVATRRQSQVIYYSIASPEAARVVALLHDIYCGAPEAR